MADILANLIIAAALLAPAMIVTRIISNLKNK